MRMSLRLRLLSLSVLAVLFFPVAGESRTAADFFKDAPDSIFHILDRNTRMDMLDYFNSGMDTRSNNVFGGKSRLTEVLPDKVGIEFSADATATLVMLPQKNDTVLAVITTVRAPMAESSLKFYDAATWKLLRRQPAQPVPKDFFDVRKLAALGRKAEIPPFLFVEIMYDPQRGVFVFRNTTAEYYSPAGASEKERRLLDSPEGVGAMLDELTYRFENGKLKKAE